MSTLAAKAMNRPLTSPIHLSRPAPGIIAALFCGYLAVGLPLPVIPLFVHDKLGFSNLIVGLVIGSQFLATVLTRGYAGRLTDHHGGKRSALQGATVCALGGLLYLARRHAGVVLGDQPRHHCRRASGRPASARASSSRAASPGRSPRSACPAPAMSMSWTGIAMFAALGIGAPIGMALYQTYGLETAMIACIVAPLIAAVIAFREASYTSPAGQRLPYYRVIGQIWREGLGLMLQGVGLSGLTAFASLYFAARSWGHAGLVMTVFGIGFIFVRVVLGSLPDRMSGYRVALWSLVIEAIGQAMLWGAHHEIVALAGALVTGLGCALIFPALGVEALKRVLPANRGSAMGAFVAFLDIAYGLSGPAAGVIAGQFGYAAVYLFGAICALLGVALVVSARGPAP